MYVGFTRAKNHLYIVGENIKHKGLYSDTQDSFARWLNLARAKNPLIERYFISDCPESRAEKKKDKTKDTFINLSSLKEQYRFRAATVTPMKYSVTALKDEVVSDIEYSTKTNYLTQEERIERGINIHKVIENIDFNHCKKEDIIDEIKRLSTEKIIDTTLLTNSDIDNIHKLMNSNLIEYARQNRYLREKKFMMYLPLNELKSNSKVDDKVLVQGAIDLLILGERNTIVDFKVSQSSVLKIKERYSQQLKIYKKAVEKLLKIQVHDTLIYVVNKNYIIYI